MGVGRIECAFLTVKKKLEEQKYVKLNVPERKEKNWKIYKTH